MSRDVLAVALLAAFVVSALALALPVVESEDSEARMEFESMVILFPDAPPMDNGLPALVAEFEHINDRVRELTDEGKAVMIHMERPHHFNKDANRLIDHMMMAIGDDLFMEPPELSEKGPRHHGERMMEERIPAGDMDDLGTVMPEFVEEVIEFADRNDMQELAEQLRERMAQNILSAIRSANNINSANTKANGVDDAEDEDQIIIVEEDDDEDEPVVFFNPIEQETVPETPVLTPAAPLYLLL